MSRWNHAICEDCWNLKQPGREPYRVFGDARQEEVCCYCFEFTVSGIYRREDPALVPCRGMVAVGMRSAHDDDE